MQVPKDADDGHIAIAIFKGGSELGMLVNKKMKYGISVPFFVRAAVTPLALA